MKKIVSMTMASAALVIAAPHPSSATPTMDPSAITAAAATLSPVEGVYYRYYRHYRRHVYHPRYYHRRRYY
jgi:hypothetical protein